MKALIIGIDGGNWRVLRREISHLRTLRKIIKLGSYGVLRSTIPPVTLPAWPSMITGYNPAKHGVVGFTDKYLRPKSFKDLKKITFWEILGFKGYKSLIVNVPMTYPPRLLNGVLIPGMGMPQENIKTYPKELLEFLKEIRYIVEAPVDVVRRLSTSYAALKELLNIEKVHTEVFLDLNDRGNFDLGFIVYRATDIVQHMVWSQKHKILNTYRNIDHMIEKIIKECSPEMVFIVSDHGFRDYNQMFSIVKYLEEKGLVKYKKLSTLGDVYKKRSNFSLLDMFSTIIRKLEVNPEDIPYFLLQALRKVVPSGVRDVLTPTREMDPKSSIAYAHWYHFGVCINEDLVGGDLYEKLRNDLIKDLISLKDDLGRPIFKWVKRREEVYDGEYAHLLPDIMFETNEWIFVSGGRWARKPIEKYYSYQHDLNGIIIAHGENIKEQTEISAQIYDVTPTILSIFNTPMPSDIDGRPILNIFNEQSLEEVKPRYVNPAVYQNYTKIFKKMASKLNKTY